MQRDGKALAEKPWQKSLGRYVRLAWQPADDGQRLSHRDRRNRLTFS
jgi:hypothetical protein